MSRIVRTREVETEIDKIADPSALAHALCNLQMDTEEFKYDKHIRGSSASKICVRDKVLGYRNNILATQRIGVSQRLIYDVGNAYHEWIQNSPAYFGERRLGWWQCLYCGIVTWGKPPKQMCKCGAGTRVIKYKEHKMEIDGEPAYVSGHPDMFLEIEPNDIRVAEIKSMKGDEFAKLSYPLADNVYQLHHYFCFLPYDNNLPIRVNPYRGLLVYVNKNPGREFPVKAFNIARDETVVRVIMQDLTEHKKAIEDETYVPAMESDCKATSWGCYRAKSCPSLEYCRKAA